MSKFPDLKNPIHFIATLGGIGKIPIAPGTWGSIFGFLVFIYISHYVDMLLVVILSIPFSIWICEKASINLIEKDHKSIVIDELVGIWVALAPALYLSTQSSRTLYVVLALIFFRLFDILKPFPISYFDKNYKNGLGIVLDDLIAGVMAIFPAMALIYLIF
ncbi:phosphatidylglycerophosphatase A [Gammaproteobacteria bacterium]|jgi:phosphatidylglycerophosphatase A|nr:phosphatidylglycerophosphatase A [Gammaproteobacteria bacterium]